MFASSFSRSFREGERPGNLSQTQIANTANIWYDAASPTYFQPTNPTNGAALTQWNDRSNAAHNAGPSGGANKPTYVTPALNGNGAVNFVSAQNLQITNVGSWIAPGGVGLPGFTMFVIAKLNTNTTGVRTLTGTDTGGFLIQLNNGVWTTTAGGGTGTVTVTPDNNWHIFTQVFDGSQVGNANRLKFRIDGTNRTLSFAAGQTVGTNVNSSTSKFNLGWDGTGNYWLGQVAEVLLFTSAQDSTQIGLIEGYLKNKWAV